MTTNKKSYLNLVSPEISVLIDTEIEKIRLRKIVNKINFLCLAKDFYTELPFGDPDCLVPQNDFYGIETLSGLLQYQLDRLYKTIQGDDYKHYLDIKRKVEEYPLPYVFNIPTCPDEDWIPTQEDFDRARTKIQSLGGTKSIRRFWDNWENYNFSLDDEEYDEDCDFIREFENNLLSTIFPVCNEFHPDIKYALSRIFAEKLTF